MLHYLSENPWPLAGALAFVAFYQYVRLRTTQDAAHLKRLGLALGAACFVFLVERLWVTEEERIESVVYELAKGLAASDGDRVAALFAPEIVVGIRNRSDYMEVDPARFRESVKTLSFDWLRVTRVRAHAGIQTKQGSAEFRVNASGSVLSSYGLRFNFATGNSEWSLGLRKSPEGNWRVTRINPVNIPNFALAGVESYLRMITRGAPFQTSPVPVRFGPRGGLPDGGAPSAPGR